MILSRGIVFYALLLAACQDSPPKESIPITAQLQPPPLPDSVLAAQRHGQDYVLDTLAIVTNQRLNTLLSLAEQRALASYSSAKALPPVVDGFFQARGSADHPFILADVGAPFEKTDVILDERLPRRQPST